MQSAPATALHQPLSAVKPHLPRCGDRDRPLLFQVPVGATASAKPSPSGEPVLMHSCSLRTCLRGAALTSRELCLGHALPQLLLLLEVM